ncbi:MAG: FxLYD domain-containing protein [Thermoplasmata archaeon]|nr:FxLYD domain-containing protein [Thermoplasmata archaeon]
MKKQLEIIGIITLFVCVGLSGCNQQSNSNIPSGGGNLNNPYSNLVEISNLKVTTYWLDITDYNYPPPLYQTDGFYHGYPKDTLFCYYYYEITGTVKNIGTKPIDGVNIQVQFFDNKSNYLDSASTTVGSIYLGNSADFKISTQSIPIQYFEYVTDYQLQVTNVILHQ